MIFPSALQLVDEALALVNPSERLIVRSSAANEDTATESNAVAYISIDGVPPDAKLLSEAIVAVFDSYRDAAGPTIRCWCRKA